MSRDVYPIFCIICILGLTTVAFDIEFFETTKSSTDRTSRSIMGKKYAEHIFASQKEERSPRAEAQGQRAHRQAPRNGTRFGRREEFSDAAVFEGFGYPFEE